MCVDCFVYLSSRPAPHVLNKHESQNADYYYEV